ncbi:MAG: hypothetical protein F4Z29_00415, partial [Gemmatimonadetes bacterium]|nr:hypothetical protein [Gemmatimonadota bacterium]
MRMVNGVTGILMAACLISGCGESAPSRDVWEEALSAKHTGLAYLYRNDLEGAAGSFESVARLVPREPLGHANRALALLKLQDYEQAAASVDRAVDLAPEDGEVLSIKSDIVAARGDREAALGLLAHAVGLNASDVELRYKYLTEMRRLRGPELPEEDTLAELRAMLEYEPENLAVLVELNATLVRLGRSQEASTGYRRMAGLLEPVPDDIQTWLDRTLDALNRGDGTEAESSAGILGNLLVVDPAYRASRDRLGDPSQQSPPLYDFRTAPPDLPSVAADSLVDMQFVDADSAWTDGILPEEEQWTDLALADVDGDGRLDLALAGRQGLTVLRNLVDSRETVSSPWSGRDVSIPGQGDAVFRLAPGDFDNDGDMDILAAGTSSLQVYLNEGDGTYGLAQTLDPGDSPRFFTTVSRADFDHDGDLDVLTSNRGALRFYRHTEDGVFEEATSATGFLESASGAPGPNAEGVTADVVSADVVAA